MRQISLGVGLAMLPSLLSPTAFAADAPDPLGRPELKDARSAEVSPLKAKANAAAARAVSDGAKADAAAAQRASTDQGRSVTWPDKGTAKLSREDPAAEPGKLPVRLGSFVWISRSLVRVCR
ncbi:hypothetical protein [Streptomyces sp. CA-251251]|uniref:hypothetical protein n=1 Tax=Streptomyces sp. CA-251251 TaxID=3240063 RepID=UPI003D8D268E